jgi:hypothetical protein
MILVMENFVSGISSWLWNVGSCVSPVRACGIDPLPCMLEVGKPLDLVKLCMVRVEFDRNAPRDGFKNPRTPMFSIYLATFMVA